MKMYILGLLALLTPSIAQAHESRFPGAAWVNVTGPHIGGEEDGNWIAVGNITQHAVISKVDNWTLSTYASVSFSKDTMGYEWNNKATPAIGLGVTKQIGSGVLSAGVQGVREYHFGKLYKTGDRSHSGIQATVTYWVGWGR